MPRLDRGQPRLQMQPQRELAVAVHDSAPVSFRTQPSRLERPFIVTRLPCVTEISESVIFSWVKSGWHDHRNVSSPKLIHQQVFHLRSPQPRIPSTRSPAIASPAFSPTRPY